MLEDLKDIAEIADAISTISDSADAVDGLITASDLADLADLSDITDVMEISETADLIEIADADDILTSSDMELGNSDVVLDSQSGHEVSFGRAPSQVESDINYYSKKLDSAQDDADYYTKQLSRSNISDTYRKDCEFKLSQAIKRINELTRKVASLGSELEKALKS